MTHRRLHILLAFSTLAAFALAASTVRFSYSPTLADHHPVPETLAAQSRRPKAAAIADPGAVPPGSQCLQAVGTVKLFCDLASSGRRASAAELLAKHSATTSRAMVILRSAKFRSARILAGAGARALNIAVRIRVPKASHGGPRRITLYFTLRPAGSCATGWQITSVARYRRPQSGPPRARHSPAYPAEPPKPGATS